VFAPKPGRVGAAKIPVFPCFVSGNIRSFTAVVFMHCVVLVVSVTKMNGVVASGGFVFYNRGILIGCSNRFL